MKFFIRSEIVIVDESGNRILGIQSDTIPLSNEEFKKSCGPSLGDKMQTDLELIRDKAATVLREGK